MLYAIDFLLDILRESGSTKPILFQQDGSLIAVTDKGFAQFSYGLLTEETVSAEDAIQEWSGDKYNKKPVFKKGEKSYFNAICFGPDHNSYSLEDMIKIYQELAKLKDDGNIRIVNHGESYHSHKYGYAGDGTDVWVKEAKVMDRKEYLKKILIKEKGILKEIENIKDRIGNEDIRDIYKKLTFPDCVIMTNNMIVSLPRDGRLHDPRIGEDDPSDSWTQKTRLLTNHNNSKAGTILTYPHVNIYQENSFGIYVRLNAQMINESNAEEFNMRSQEAIEGITKELSGVNSIMYTAERYFAKPNAIHNEVCAPYIKRRT